MIPINNISKSLEKEIKQTKRRLARNDIDFELINTSNKLQDSNLLNFGEKPLDTALKFFHILNNIMRVRQIKKPKGLTMKIL